MAGCDSKLVIFHSFILYVRVCGPLCMPARLYAVPSPPCTSTLVYPQGFCPRLEPTPYPLQTRGPYTYVPYSPTRKFPHPPNLQTPRKSYQKNPRCSWDPPLREFVNENVNDKSVDKLPPCYTRCNNRLCEPELVE